MACFGLARLAEQGDAMTPAGLGILYGAGQGVPRDFAEAYFTPVDSVLRVVDLITRHGHTTPHAHNEATSDWAIRA
jgi:hypothetical protein